MKHTRAMLIVDMQNCFFPGGELPVPKGDETLGPANRVITFAENKGMLKFKSRDWHAKDMLDHFKIFPVHGVENTWGAEFHPLLTPCTAIVVSKGMKPNTHGFSPFEGVADNGETLDEILRRFGVSELLIFGLATDYCVKAAALDAAKLGYKVFVLIDACRAVNIHPDDETKAIAEMKAAGVLFASTDDVINGRA